MRMAWRSLAIAGMAAASASSGTVGAALGADAPDWRQGWVERVVVGGAAHDPFETTHREQGADLQAEAQFRSLIPEAAGASWMPSLRPTLGGYLNLAGETSLFYGGLTAELAFENGVFIGGFFGLAGHSDGGKSDDLGCEALFRSAAEAGYRFGAQAVSAQISHASHGGILCGDVRKNAGLDQIGLRYSWVF